MNNYVYYDIFLAKKRCERWRPALARATALYNLTSYDFDRPQFPNSPQRGLFAPRACFRRGVVNSERLAGTSPKGYNREI
ncbi:MAG: hypothetical protein WCF82_27380 [Microcoleus sp.]